MHPVAVTNSCEAVIVKLISFFATRSDLLGIFDKVDAQVGLVYAKCGSFSSPEAQIFRRGRDLPNLGCATVDATVTSDTFLILEHPCSIKTRSRTIQSGETRYFIDQLENPNSITLTPGGQRHDVLIAGRIATVHTDKLAQGLMSSFYREIRRAFSHIGAYWAGPSAAADLDSGRRLTAALQSPAEFDLRRELP